MTEPVSDCVTEPTPPNKNNKISFLLFILKAGLFGHNNAQRDGPDICDCWNSSKRHYQTELGMTNEIWYFGTIGGTFKYQNIKHNIGTDTDIERMIPNDFFGIS